MAITRSAKAANARSLRSGRAMPKYKASVLSSPGWKRSTKSSLGRKLKQRLSGASAQEEGSLTATLCEDISMNGDGETAGGIGHLGSSDFQGGVNSPGPTLSVPLPLTFPPPSMDSEEESPGSAPRRQDDIVNVREQPPLPDPKDIGLPSGGVWNIDGACGERFCYEHGEYEYLLMTPNRWMFADSVGVPEGELDARLLQKDSIRPVKSKPAQCGGTLYSHVQRVICKASHDGGNIYEIEWRNCWTLASHIGENDWFLDSLKLNLDKSLRCSTRLSNTADERKMRNVMISRIMQLDL